MLAPDALILGLETSCDETAAAVVAGGSRVLANAIASQHDLHAEYRGVVPEIASRAHAERLLPIAQRAVREAGVRLEDLDAVAVGHRPGLIGALLVGVAGAKALAWSLGVPLVGVDHVHAHLYAPLMDAPADAAHPPHPPLPPLPPHAASASSLDMVFPALGLVVSGGHTALYRLTSPTAIQRLGGTIDDALGEAFDKVAAILGLGFPGGPAVDALSRRGRGDAHRLPVSALGPDSLDFSFSGLKTAVLYAAYGVPERAPAPRAGLARAPSIAAGPDTQRPLDEQTRADLCASFQEAAVRAVLLKLDRAHARHPDARTLLVGGGVSANSRLRAGLIDWARGAGLGLRLPPLALCVDNAAMIAGLAHHLLAARGGVGDDLALTASPS